MHKIAAHFSDRIRIVAKIKLIVGLGNPGSKYEDTRHNAGEWMIARLARRFNVTELVIGLTVVAFGTSLPEFVTSFMSTLKGSSDISIGNIVGSNIFNALMIVGCAAWLSPITISKSTIAKDIPFALLASLVLGVVSVDSLLDNGAPDILSRTDGLVLLGYFSVFMAYTYFISRNKEAAADMQQSDKPQQLMPYWKIQKHSKTFVMTSP